MQSSVGISLEEPVMFPHASNTTVLSLGYICWIVLTNIVVQLMTVLCSPGGLDSGLVATQEDGAILCSVAKRSISDCSGAW